MYKSEKIKLGIALQDIRIWGSVPQINKTDGLTSIHEAWGEYFITPKFSIKAGRQELDYDDSRILGNLDWAQQGRSHDVLKVVYADSSWALHAGAAYNQDNLKAEGAKIFNTYYDVNGLAQSNYKQFHYIWFGKELKSFKFSLLGINNGVQLKDSTERFTQTAGTNLSYKAGKFLLNGTFYYQTGKDDQDRSVNSYLYSWGISYSGIKNLTITPGMDVLSGSTASDLSNRENHSFNPLYGTHHKFYGHMDYFYVGNAHGPGGLTDLYLKAKYSIGSKSTLLADFHSFASQADIADPADNTKSLTKGLGQEVDLMFVHTISKEVLLHLGYSQLFGTSTMEVLKGGDKNNVSNWAWVMLTFKPVLMKK